MNETLMCSMTARQAVRSPHERSVRRGLITRRTAATMELCRRIQYLLVRHTSPHSRLPHPAPARSIMFLPSSFSVRISLFSFAFTKVFTARCYA